MAFHSGLLSSILYRDLTAFVVAKDLARFLLLENGF
jgi:hypothetical protein